MTEHLGETPADPLVGRTSLLGNLADLDHAFLGQALRRLLSHGSILREDSPTRELYDWCRDHRTWLDESARLIGLNLAWEHEHRLVLAVPVTADLRLRLRMDESLVIMALWFDYDVAIREEGETEVSFPVSEFNERLTDKFHKLKPPSETRLREIFRLLERKNLIRLRPGPTLAESEIRVLPTIRYVIPFPAISDWQRQWNRYEEEGPEAPPVNSDLPLENHEPED